MQLVNDAVQELGKEGGKCKQKLDMQQDHLQTTFCIPEFPIQNCSNPFLQIQYRIAENIHI
jgi:hypothetical protein